MRVVIIGYGAVASIHARKLLAVPGVKIMAVTGPSREKAAAFASRHGIPDYTDGLAGVLRKAEVALVCSPSPVHFEQAYECLQAGVHTLVEFPPCEGGIEAERLATMAAMHKVVIRCAHTSRFLAPFIRLKECLQVGHMGSVDQVIYVRHHVLRERSWIDNALLHHAAHGLDLLIDWFGGVEPLGCTAVPDVHNAQSVSLLARLAQGAAVSISISYTSRLPRRQMIVVGRSHTADTDGFSYIRSDLEKLNFEAEEQEVYENAIADQDMEFLRACKGKPNGVTWLETLKLTKLVDHFRVIGEASI